MAEPVKVELVVEATLLKDRALQSLRLIAESQLTRWDVLRRVITNAGDQYFSDRQKGIEARIQNQGAPSWFSCILTVGITLIPVSFATQAFLHAATLSLKKVIARADRAQKAQRESLKFLESYATNLGMNPSNRKKLAEEIKRTDAQLIAFVKKYPEAEVTNTMQDLAHNLKEIKNDPPFIQNSKQNEFNQRSDAPLVVVKESLNQGLDLMVKAQNAARTIIENRILNLFAIATSPTPDKMAISLEAEAEKKESAKEPHLRKPVEKLPKTTKESMDMLKEERDELAPILDETLGNLDAEKLADLQMIIEAMIWTTTYDFKLRTRKVWVSGGEPRLGHWETEIKPAPLPDETWEILIDRFIDPDEHKTFRKAGSLERLGTIEEPSLSFGVKWDPKVRLSYYFGEILQPKIQKEYDEMLKKVTTREETSLPPPPPGLKPHKFK